MIWNFISTVKLSILITPLNMRAQTKNKPLIGSTRDGVKRTFKNQKVTVGNSFSKASLRRLARQGGVKRISTGAIPELRTMIVKFMETVIRDALTFAEYAKRKTIMVMDIIFALKRHGKPMYGFYDAK